MSDLYIVKWKSKLTKASGYGYPVAKEQAEHMSKRERVLKPDFEYWIEKVTEKPQTNENDRD